MAVIPAPMLASAGGKPFTSDEWLYEIKFDGYRCLARVQDGVVQLRTKSGADCTKWYPEVAEPRWPVQIPPPVASQIPPGRTGCIISRWSC